MKKTLRKIIAIGVSLATLSSSFTTRCWAECQDGTTVTGTAVTTDVTTPTTTDTTAATSATTPTTTTTTNTTTTEWRQPCVDGLFQPSDSVNPETSICGYSLNPLDYYSVAEWEQMVYDYRQSEGSVNFVENCKQGWDFPSKLPTQLAGCRITYQNEAKTTYQAYRKNGKKFDAFLTLEDAYSKKKLKRMKKWYHYKSIKELVENKSVQVDEAEYNKRFEIDKKKALKVGDYIQIESYLETQRVFTCFIPISAEKEKEIFDVFQKSYPINKNSRFGYRKVNNFYVDVIPASWYQKGAPAYLVLNFDDTINSKDRPEWCRYAKMKYYIGQSYGFKDSALKYDQIQTDNMNSSIYYHSFFHYFKVKKQLDSHGNLKAKVILKRPILWRRCGSYEDRYWLDSSPSGNIPIDCVDFMTKTVIDLYMPDFTTKLVGLTKEERKHLSTSKYGAAIVYWKNGMPEKYGKLAGSTSRCIREKDYIIKIKNPPFSD